MSVITAFPNRPAGRLFDGYKRRPWTRDNSFTDYRVLRLFSIFSSESGVSSRFLENLSFGIASGLAVLFGKKPDVVYGNTWPIFSQAILAFICKMRRIPLVLSIQDVYPETLAVQGRGGNLYALLHAILRWLDRKTAGSCAGLVVISEQFRQIYLQDRGIPLHKVHLVPNWMDEKKVQTGAQENNIRRLHGIPEEAFLVVYAGNVGFAAGVETVIRAFQNVGSESPLHLLIAGEGSMLEACRRMAGKLGDHRVAFHHPWPVEETSSVLSAADLFVLPTQGSQSLVSVPSKLISYMLASRPVLATAAPGSEVAHVISESGSGWVAAPDEPEELAELMKRISLLPKDELATRGRAGREFALRCYSRDANLNKLIEVLEEGGNKSV